MGNTFRDPFKPRSSPPLSGLTSLRDVSPTKSETSQSPGTKGLPSLHGFQRISFLFTTFVQCKGDFLKSGLYWRYC